MTRLPNSPMTDTTGTGDSTAPSSLSSVHRPALPPGLGAALLDPRVWQESLATYARAVNLAVATADAHGVVAELINPQPLWTLFNSSRPAAPAQCTFSLAAEQPCTCVARAIRLGGAVFARDRIGMVHFAVPLSFDGRAVGALIAGQVFEQYPEPDILERFAATYKLSSTRVWQAARHVPARGPATLQVYAALLSTLGKTILQSRYHIYLEAERLTEMTRLRDQLALRTDELIASGHRKDEFLAMLAHELRNPLAPLVNAVHMIQMRGAEQRSSASHAVDIITRQVGQLVRLVDDLLNVARVTAGHIMLQQEPTELGTIVQDAVEAVRPELDERGQKLEVRLGDKPVWVHADRIRLVQVFTNLLNNASKFTKKGGQIGIAVDVESTDAVVRVWDSGSGMPAHLLPHIFDLFVQGAESPARSRGGLGIGLTVVRRLIELHGGTVSAASAGAGHGSEFTVRLSRIAPAPPCPTEEPRQPPRRGAHSHRILVVDDNDDAATSLQMLLEQWGHEVSTASDGPTALRMARQFRPDVVLLDIGLPHMDGYEVARQLRGESEKAAGGDAPDGGGSGEDQNVQLIAVTGYGQEEDRRRGRSAGFDHHFVKPIDLDALRKVLD